MRCENCQIELNENGVCPQCGHRYILLEEHANLYEGNRLRKKDKNRYSSKKHPYYYEEMDLYELQKRLGEYVRRYKKEDRLNDMYEETVTRQNGEVIHQCKEKLSSHIKHGCAKKKDTL